MYVYVHVRVLVLLRRGHHARTHACTCSLTPFRLRFRHFVVVVAAIALARASPARKMIWQAAGGHACSTHARANRPHTRTHARAHARTHAHTHAHTHLPVLIWLAAGGRASRNTCKQPARMRARTHARHTQAFTHADLAGSRRQACTNTLTYVATHANCPSTHAPQSTNSSATSTARMPQPATAMHGDERRPPSAVRSSAALAVRRACTCARCQHVAVARRPTHYRIGLAHRRTSSCAARPATARPVCAAGKKSCNKPQLTT